MSNKLKKRSMGDFSKGNDRIFKRMGHKDRGSSSLKNSDEYDPTIERARVKYRYATKRWFGVKGWSVYESLMEFGVAVRYVNVDFLECECYAPDPEYDDCCIYFVITEDELERIVKGRRDLHDFLTMAGVTLVNFILMEMPDKIYYLSQFYDFIELLGLDEDIEATPREEISIKIKSDNKRK